VAGAAVLRGALGRLAALGLDVEVDRLVVAALRRAAPGPAGPVLHAGLEAGLHPEVALTRASTAFLAFATFNLSDDLSDGECDYLPAPAGEAVVLLLHGLFFAALRDLDLGAGVESDVLGDLAAAEAAQVAEVTTSSWTAARLQAVTDGIAGRQWSAYLRLMWAATPLEPRAPVVARALGRVALLAGDITSVDVRYTGLDPGDRATVLRDALRAVDELAELGLACTGRVVDEGARVLGAALAALSTGAPGSTGGQTAAPLAAVAR
jgi:hypothetical protein